MGNFMEMRARHKDDFQKKHGVKLVELVGVVFSGLIYLEHLILEPFWEVGHSDD